MKVIAVTNRKGGVGKSTLTVHLAAGLAIRGQRVLVVDCDPQGQCATLLGQEKADGLFNLLVGDLPYEDLLIPVEPHRYTLDREIGWTLLGLLRSDKSTAFIPYRRNDRLLLAQKLHEIDLGLGFDVILLDTPPSANVFDAAIYAAADGMIFVTEASTLALDGLREGIADFDGFNAQRVEEGRTPLALLGILPNKVTANTRVQRKNLSFLAELEEHLWPPVFRRAVWEEAAGMGVTVFAHRPDSAAAAEAWAAVDQLERTLAAWT